jgi:hypothetical protein
MLEGKKVAFIRSMGIMFSIQSGTERQKSGHERNQCQLAGMERKRENRFSNEMNGKESADPERWLGGELV